MGKIVKDLVSVMIPTYNRPEMFEQALQSVLAQDYPHLEILVADNGTNDATETIVQQYLDDPRLQYRRNKDAATKADNFSVFEKWAKGEYLQWLMDDDMLAPQKISRMVMCFRQQPQVTLVTSRRQCIDAEGRLLSQAAGGININGEYGLFDGNDVGYATLMDCGNFIGEPSAVLFRRKDLKHHYWRADCRGYLVISDVVMWLELMEKGSMAMFRDPLSYCRIHPHQEGKQIDVMLLGFTEWFRLLTEYRRRNVFLRDDKDYRSALIKFHRFFRDYIKPEQLAAATDTRRQLYDKYVRKIMAWDEESNT